MGAHPARGHRHLEHDQDPAGAGQPRPSQQPRGGRRETGTMYSNK